MARNDIQPVVEIGTYVSVFWGRFGWTQCKIARIAPDGDIYAVRWLGVGRGKEGWTVRPRPIEWSFGSWHVAN